MSSSSSSSTWIRTSSSSSCSDSSSSSSSTLIMTSSSSSSSDSSSSSSSSSSTFIMTSSSSSSSADIIKLCSGDIFVFPESSYYIDFKYCQLLNTFATIVLGGTSFLVGDLNGQFVWDYNGDGQYTFQNIGEYTRVTIGHRTFKITFRGYGSYLFSISALENRNRTVPFVFDSEKNNSIWTMVANGEDVYAGTGPEGIVLKSQDRVFWSEIYRADDVAVKALYIVNNQLFIGSSPNGNIYIMNLDTEETSLSQQIGGNIYGFIYYKDELYVAGGNPTNIYRYNSYKNRWDIFYTPYSSVITKMLIYNDMMYVFFDDKNFISFDGEFWKLQSPLVDNISSIRNVSMEPYSEVTQGFIDRANVKSVALVNDLDPEEVYDVFPLHYARGIQSADADSPYSLVVGSSEYGKVYRCLATEDKNYLYPIFQTESGNTVHYILNVDFGANLAAIDNKLHLIHSGNVSSTTTTTTVMASGTTTTTSTALPSVVKIVNPIGGEQFVIGDTVNILWTSTKGINDAVKIDLYKGNTLNTEINVKTTNDGTYEWQIPTGLIPGNDYKIRVTWLTAGNSQDSENSSESKSFYILAAPLITTTTTSTVANLLGIPDDSNSRGIPLLELPENEYITFMMKDVAKGGILLATSRGRILGCNEVLINAYLTGNRNVYAEVKDGFGNVSDTAWTSFFYALYNKIVEINESKEIVKWQYQVQPTALLVERITGEFYSPILYVRDDLDFWKQLIWREEKHLNTEIIICIRAANSEKELKLTTWDYCFTSRDSDRGYGSTGYIIRELSDYQIKGKYLQFKVIMTSDVANVSPSVLSLMITYSTKFAAYFYTTKFKLQNSSLTKSGLITASMTIPQNTEIKFGISDKNSSNWEDYTVVPVNKLFSLNSLDNLKVGIKMITYDEHIPEVAEFALLTGAEKDNEINGL